MREHEGDPTLGRTLIPALSARQTEALGRLLLGESEQRIAWRMRIAPATLRTHVKYLYRTFGVRTRGELINAVFDIMRASKFSGR